MRKTQEKFSANAPARQLLVDAEDAGQRLDNFLARELKGLPRSRLYRLVRRGEVRVNSGRARPSRKLAAGDRVRLPPLRLPSQPDAAPTLPGQALPILHEDERLLVLDKPPGMAVHGGSGVPWGVIEALRQQRQDEPRLELAHRLDRDTSGCLMVARRPSYLRLLQGALRTRRIAKRYLALVHGAWPDGLTEMDAPLATHASRDGEKTSRVSPEGRPAQSRFRTLLASPEASLLEVEILTGRTHQIRVHAQAAGHPLVGDGKYGDARLDKRLAAAPGRPRLMLHAAALAIPALGEAPALEVAAPLEKRFAEWVHGHFGFDMMGALC